MSTSKKPFFGSVRRLLTKRDDPTTQPPGTANTSSSQARTSLQPRRTSARLAALPPVPTFDSAPISMPDGSRRLRCLIEGKSEVFSVEVSRPIEIEDLKKEIWELVPHTLKDVGFHELALWKVNIDLENHDDHTLGDLKLESLDGVEKLASWKLVQEYWSNQPPIRHLHIIVKVPATGPRDIRRKHSAPELAEGVFDRLKRTKIATNAPSDTGRPSIYERLQREPFEKILDDRPQQDPDIPPIPLLYDGFGHFLDIMDGRGDVPGLADVNVPKLRKAVDDLASKMTGYFSKEDERRDAALPCLNEIFGARGGTGIPPLSASAIGSVRSDGHNTATHGAGTMTVELKNWGAGIGALPQIELLGYIARLDATRMNDEDLQQLYLRWRVPCVGLTIVGCDITFYAVVPIDHRFRLVTLTPTFSCIQSASDGRDRKSLYSAFTAASVLQARIVQDATRLLQNPSPLIPALARHFPAVSALRKHPPSDAHLTFEIQSFFPDRQTYRLLYVAETQGADKQLVLIKFARQYSIELHEICANSGHAPSILAFERLPGGWFAVAMEYIQPGVSITQSSLLPAHRDRWMDELQDLMDSFHKRGFVHGDLRDANIICKKDSVMLIDFDWGGKVGEASYPTWNLNDELVRGRMSADLTITKEDDRRVLKNTLAKLTDIQHVVLR